MATIPDPVPEDIPSDGAQGPQSEARGAEPSAAELLDQVLNPLLTDFEDTFARGLFLLEHCPDRVLPEGRRLALRERLRQAQAELGAARALRSAAPTPMALEMATIQPWHALVVEVWSLSTAMRLAGVAAVFEERSG
jgi:hypothetical protein